jgi:hypothetical protein
MGYVHLFVSVKIVIIRLIQNKEHKLSKIWKILIIKSNKTWIGNSVHAKKQNAIKNIAHVLQME